MEKIYKYLLLLIGTISLALGLVGIALPLLPTTPFLLLTAACYYRGSDKMYNYLITHKIFGKFIDDYRNRGGIALHVKIYTLIALWASISYCIFFLNISTVANIALFLVATTVTYHISSKKTLRD